MKSGRGREHHAWRREGGDWRLLLLLLLLLLEQGGVTGHERLVGGKLSLELILGERIGVVFRPFGGWLRDGGSGGVDAGFLLLTSAILLEQIGRESFHSKDFDIVAVSTGQSVFQPTSDEKQRRREEAGERRSMTGRDQSARQGMSRWPLTHPRLLSTHSLVGLELVYLLNMNGKTSGSVELPRAVITLEVFGLLMLHQD